MWTGDAAGGTHKPHYGLRRDDVTYPHVEFRQMCEHRQQSAAVINDDGVPGEVQRSRERDDAVIRRINRRTWLAHEIDTCVRSARLAVVVAARAEIACRSSTDRKDENTVPPLRRVPRVRLSHTPLIRCNLLERVSRRIHKSLSHAQAPYPERLRNDA